MVYDSMRFVLNEQTRDHKRKLEALQQQKDRNS